MAITVITPSLPERAELLADAIESVQAQTLPAHDHLVYLDGSRIGPALGRNLLLSEVTTEHVAMLDDDDLLYPEHLARLAAVIGNADLAFSWHDDGPSVPRYDSWDYSAYWTMQQGRNVIPVTVLARTDSIRRAGCFNPDDRYEDYALFMRMLALGMRFVCVPEVTWRYRIAVDGRTWNP